MGKGKLISVTQKVRDGVQETYSGKDGVMYKFNVKFLHIGGEHDGKEITGDCLGKTPNSKLEVNKEYLFEISSREYNGNTYYFYKGIKDPNSSFGGGGAKKDPAFVVQKAFECAVETTLMFFKLNKAAHSDENEGKLIATLFNFCCEGDEKKRWANIASLRLAITKADMLGIAINSTWLIENAKHISEAMINTVANQIKFDTSNQPK